MALRRSLLAASLLLAPALAPASTVVSCPFSGTNGDGLARGIVVPNYAGTNVRRVGLSYFASVAGLYHVTAQIRRGTFDGPIVGTSTLYLTVSTSSMTSANFDFGAAPVTTGDTLAIIQTATGPGSLFFDNGVGTAGCGQAYETGGTTPPLDTLRNSSIGIQIDQDDLSGACIPSDTVLCVDDTPGDRRFKLTLAYSHAGGSSGSAQAIPLSPVGIAQGGAFWIFSQNNPEMLVKVLNACAINGNYWVFGSAGTNIGLTLHAADTTGSATKTYTNTDNTAAQPIQDTSAFPCSSSGSPIAAFAGNWTGQWNNTTFSTTGPASMAVTIDTTHQTFQAVMTIGGSVFGGSAPPPQTFSGPYNSSGVTITANGTAFGNITATISSSGAISGSGTSVPNPNISRVDFTGTATASVITINYTITFSASAGGGTAVGVMTLNHS